MTIQYYLFIYHSMQSARSAMSNLYSNLWFQIFKVSSVETSLKIIRSKDSFLARSSGMNFIPRAKPCCKMAPEWMRNEWWILMVSIRY
jgi:hypothetical protein